MSWNFELIAGPYGGITEGPVWDGGALLFSNIENNRVLRYAPSTGEVTVVRGGTNGGNGLVRGGTGCLYCCEGGGTGRRVTRYNDDGTTTVIADRYEGKRLNSPNDLVFDSKGRLWFTDPRYGDFRADMELDHESVYRCDPQTDGSWSIQRMAYDTGCPNGLLFSKDEKKLYVAESKYGDEAKRELRAYLVLEDGTLGDYEVLHNFYPHRGVDGMCLDAAGNIVATAGWDQSGPGSMIYVFAPNGRVLSTHPVPADRPTNCCFGDADLHALYVTTVGGHLFRARLK
ncbi:MAG: SMP-30/gluconolactonase/LRE family protein [candidate division Zixibacteria bacterium]|nr:SMP-30/gluconolactonase/LRE family protein [candidate division Zixibacteria bacterium]